MLPRGYGAAPIRLQIRTMSIESPATDPSPLANVTDPFLTPGLSAAEIDAFIAAGSAAGTLPANSPRDSAHRRRYGGTSSKNWRETHEQADREQIVQTSSWRDSCRSSSVDRRCSCRPWR
jgi:hypothetical protein